MYIDEIFNSKYYEFDSYLAKLIPKKGMIFYNRGNIYMIVKIATVKKDSKLQRRVKIIKLGGVDNPILNNTWYGYNDFINYLVRWRHYMGVQFIDDDMQEQYQNLKNYRKLSFKMNTGFQRNDFLRTMERSRYNDMIIHISKGKLANIQELQLFAPNLVMDDLVLLAIDRIKHRVMQLERDLHERSTSFVLTDVRNDKGEVVYDKLRNLLINRKIKKLSNPDEIAQVLWTRFIEDMKTIGYDKYMVKEQYEYDSQDLF